MPKGEITPQQVMQQQAFQNIAGHLGNAFVPPNQQRQVAPVNPMLPLQMQLIQGQLGQQKRQNEQYDTWQKIMGGLQTGTIEEVPTMDPMGIGEVASVQKQGPLSDIPPPILEMARVMGPQQGAALIAQYKMKELGKKPSETFETVQNPFGLGGVGQRNAITGKIENYQKPESAQSSIGKLQADLKSGRITQDQYNTALDILRKPLVNIAEPYKPLTEPAKLRADKKYLKDIGLSDDAPEIKAIDRQLAKIGVPSGESMRMQEMVQSGSRTLDTLSKKLMPNDKVDMGAVRGMWANLPFTEERKEAAQFKEAAGLMLRLETGAQANAEEINNLAQRYMPTPWDDEATVKDKLMRFKQRFDTAKGIAEGREGGQTPTKPGSPQPGVTEDGYRFKGGDPGDPNNWEKVN